LQLHSLYGHLSAIAVELGQEVRRGERIAVWATGEGLNQARAHVHLELNLMLSRHFEDWCVLTTKRNRIEMDV
jgi:murein DD-endopeptidase MepM/ murein hydrolase activator NlpD